MTDYYFTHCRLLATRIRTYQKANNEIAWRDSLTELKYYCQKKAIDFSLFGINENPISPPQLPTADVPLPAVIENIWPATESVPLLEVDQTSLTAFKPLPIIQISRANKCKLETCLNDVDGKIYCSDKCRIKFNNLKRSTKSA